MSADLVAFDSLGDWEDYRIFAVPREAEVDVRDTREPSAEALALEARILDLQNQLTALLKEQEVLLAKHALIARLPSEILARIFELGVHDDLHLLPRISLVCRLWRQVALETPTLSSYLRLDGSWGYGGSRRFLDHTKVLLERAGDSKLCVELDCRYVDDTTALEDLASGIGPHLGRAYSFQLSVPDWDWFTLLQSHAAPNLGSNLQELTLRIDPSDEPVMPTQFLVPGQTYERLYKLVLEQVPLISIRGAHLPSLRSLRLSRDTRFHSLSRMTVVLAELIDFLRSHPQLEELYIHGARFALDVSSAALLDVPERVHTPALKKVSFNQVDGAGIGAFLTSLNTPVLEALVVSMDACDNSDLGFLATIIAECGSSLVTSLRLLDIRNINTDGSALFPFARILRRLPNLTALGICSPPSGTIGGKFFDLLANPSYGASGETWLLPKLKALAIVNARDVSGHEVLGVIRARKSTWISGGGDLVKASPVEKMDFVRVAQCYGLEDDTVDTLRDAVEVFRHGL